MDLDPRYLEVFFTVCREGGFGRAAAAMHRTQPAISYQIRMLERQLGTQLVERGQRQLLLTPEGKRLREFCERFFGEFGRLATSFTEGVPTRVVSGPGVHIPSAPGETTGRLVCVRGQRALLERIGGQPAEGSTDWRCHLP